MTVPKQISGHWSKGNGPSDPGKPPHSGREETRTSMQESSWASFSRATMSGKQDGNEQPLTGANKDEYLMNLFRREDMGYANPQPSALPQGGQPAKPSLSGQPYCRQQQPVTTFPVVSLPGYPGCGPLPRHGTLAAQQQPPVRGLAPEKVKERMGLEEYQKLRDVVLHHQETFVEQLYDLHRLVRRQQHLESNCRQRSAYDAELRRLEAAQQGSAEAGAMASDEAHWQQQEPASGNHRSTEPSTERKGSNTPGESSDLPAANGSGRNRDSQAQEQLPQGLGVAASLLQQQHQNLEAAQAHAAAAAIEVQRQQNLLAAAAQAQATQQQAASHHSIAASHQVQATAHQRTMEAAAESHMQHQHFMAAAAQAHMQHRQDMAAAAQARAQQQADIAEAQMAYGSAAAGTSSGGGGGGSGRRGPEVSGPGQNGAQSMGASPLNASRFSFVQGSQQQNGAASAHSNMGQVNFQQGFNPMGMMNGYGYGYGSYGTFYPGFGGYPNMSNYQFNPYSIAGAAGAMGFDPMQSWYMHHYGRGATQATADAEQLAAEGAAAAAEAAADAQAQQQQEADARAAREQANGASLEHAASALNPPRWWQDPAQVFGPEVLPEVVARRSSPQRLGTGNGVNSSSARLRGTSRPGSKHERQRDDWEAAGIRVPPEQAAKKANTGSGGRHHEATGQTTDGSMFGSGGSAFRKIPQRPRSVRSIGRTNSIGSENSKSSVGATAAAQQATRGNVSPPKQMESAANILVGFSGQQQH